MQIELFVNSPTGALTPINGVDTRFGEWSHVAFIPNPLPDETPALTARTFNAVSAARARLASLDALARQLPNPTLLRAPTLRREAQSTSALEGTYAPLEQVLGADKDEEQSDSAMREVLNYVAAAEHAFQWLSDERPLTVGLLQDLQGRLVRGTAADTAQAGRIRASQVVIGTHRGARVQDARFIPAPPGPELDALVRDCVDWTAADHGDDIDPVVAAGMVHYQFETLHPFNDGNGRIGRLMVVLHLLAQGVLTEPTLTVSPWFEARRSDYYDRLLAVSSVGNWDGWIRFFADGVAASADTTNRQLHDLLTAQEELKQKVRSSGLRAENALRLVDFTLTQPIFTVRQVQRHLQVSYPRANGLVAQLTEIGVLNQYGTSSYDRRFTAPEVLAVLLR